MLRSTTTIQPDRAVDAHKVPIVPADDDSGRLASLASLALSNRPGLTLPSLRDVATSYTVTRGSSSLLDLAKTFVQLGLGTPALWRAHLNAPSLFVENALREWLLSIGTGEFEEMINFHLFLGDQPDGVNAIDGKLFLSLETTDGCGYLQLGEAIQALEIEAEGLGKAFYMVLLHTMNQWMYIYHRHQAELFHDQWRESIEMDMADSEEESGGDAGQARNYDFNVFCEEKGILFPDLNSEVPLCVRDLKGHGKSLSGSLRLLKQHAQGPHGSWIEHVLAVHRSKRKALHRTDLPENGMWDGEPLPNWLISFGPDDPIVQAFDEEARNFGEYSHEPLWLVSFDPANREQTWKVLHDVKIFVNVNRHLVALRRLLETKDAHGSINQPQQQPALRAA